MGDEGTTLANDPAVRKAYTGFSSDSSDSLAEACRKTAFPSSGCPCRAGASGFPCEDPDGASGTLGTDPFPASRSGDPVAFDCLLPCIRFPDPGLSSDPTVPERSKTRPRRRPDPQRHGKDPADSGSVPHRPHFHPAADGAAPAHHPPAGAPLLPGGSHPDPDPRIHSLPLSGSVFEALPAPDRLRPVVQSLRLASGAGKRLSLRRSLRLADHPAS